MTIKTGKIRGPITVTFSDGRTVEIEPDDLLGTVFEKGKYTVQFSTKVADRTTGALLTKRCQQCHSYFTFSVKELRGEKVCEDCLVNWRPDFRIGAYEEIPPHTPKGWRY